MLSRRKKIAPNYRAENIPVTINQYRNDRLLEQVSYLMSLGLEPYDGRERDMDNLRQIKVASELGKGAMMLTHFESSTSDSGCLILYGAGAWGNPTAPAGKLEITEIAHQAGGSGGVMPDVLTLPTSTHKPSVAKEVARTGSFMPLGEAIAPVIERYAHDYDDIVVLGNSFGGRVVPASITMMSDRNAAKLSEVVIFDSPSNHEQLGWRIVPAQAREIGHQKQYTTQSQDKVAQDAWTGDMLRKADKTLPTASPLTMVRDITAMAKLGFQDDLDEALPKVPHDTPVTLFAPELSELNDNTSRKVNDFVERLSSDHPESDLRLAELGGTTHNILAGHPDIFARALGYGAITFSGRK